MMASGAFPEQLKGEEWEKVMWFPKFSITGIKYFASCMLYFEVQLHFIGSS